jgi:hypothetical protein
MVLNGGMATRPAPVARYRCEHSVSAQCSAGNGRPTRKRCRCCAGRLLIEQGLWTVRRWDETKRGQGYGAMEIVREFRSETTARKFANAEGDCVWHFARHGETTIHGQES